MFTFTKTFAALALMGALTAPGAATAQEADDGMGAILMGLDGSAAGDAGIAAVTGWHICTVVRTGAGWGNHYVALTCPSGGFTNKWHIMKDAQKDAMLATALSAATGNIKVQTYIGAQVSGYQEIQAFYLHK